MSGPGQTRGSNRSPSGILEPEAVLIQQRSELLQAALGKAKGTLEKPPFLGVLFCQAVACQQAPVCAVSVSQLLCCPVTCRDF